MHSSFKSMLIAAFLTATSAQAAVSVFDNKASFLGATGASQATQPYPANPWPAFAALFSLTSGSVTLTTSTGMYVSTYSPRIAGNVISINDVENLDALFAAPVYAMGFDFVEPEFDPNVNAPFADSTFTVTLLNGSSVVDSFQFNAPSDTAAFVGAWSTDAFDRAFIRETTGGIENDMFGQFYTGAVAMPVPEPGMLALVLAGLGVTGLATRRVRTPC